MGKLQEAGARQILELIKSVYEERRNLTYGTAAEALGRPRSHARAVAQMCDLLDAAAACQRVPLLALIAVRNTAGKINPDAWKDRPELKKRIVATSLATEFGPAEFRAIEVGLDTLKGLGNHAAWKRVYELVPQQEVFRVIGGDERPIEIKPGDPDAEAVEGNKQLVQHLKRERKAWLARRKREASRSGNGGLECEACGENSKTRYPSIEPDTWEVHHRLPLSEAEEPVTNSLKDLAILCPTCHRAIHRTKPMMTVEAFQALFFPKDAHSKVPLHLAPTVCL